MNRHERRRLRTSIGDERYIKWIEGEIARLQEENIEIRKIHKIQADVIKTFEAGGQVFITDDSTILHNQQLIPYKELEEERVRNTLIDIVFDKVREAAFHADQTRMQVFTALVFRSSLGWTVGLKTLQNAMNIAEPTCVQTIKWAARTLPADDDVWVKLENHIQESTGRVNDAINKAIGDDDGGAALEILAREQYRPLADIINEYRQTMQTDHIATDTNITGATIHIGYYCNVLEAQGKTRIRDQWQTIHRHLKGSQILEGNAKDALEYLTYLKPWNMDKNALRDFEKRISDMKQKMKKYYETITAGQTSDTTT